ncbi:hypothetical protein H4R33_006822, partial [Dimargaris cristalligena]
NGLELSIHNTPNDDTIDTTNHISSSFVASEPALTDALVVNPAHAELLDDLFSNLLAISSHFQLASNGLKMSMFNSPDSDTTTMASHLASFSIASEPAPTGALVVNPANAELLVDLFSNLLAMSSHLQLASNSLEMFMFNTSDDNTNGMASHISASSVTLDPAPTETLVCDSANAEHLVDQLPENYVNSPIISSPSEIARNGLEMSMYNSPDDDTATTAEHISLLSVGSIPTLIGTLASNISQDSVNALAISSNIRFADNSLGIPVLTSSTDVTGAAMIPVASASASNPISTNTYTYDPDDDAHSECKFAQGYTDMIADLSDIKLTNSEFHSHVSGIPSTTAEFSRASTVTPEPAPTNSGHSFEDNAINSITDVFGPVPSSPMMTNHIVIPIPSPTNTADLVDETYNLSLEGSLAEIGHPDLPEDWFQIDLQSNDDLDNDDKNPDCITTVQCLKSWFAKWKG